MKCHITFHRKLKLLLNHNFKQIIQTYKISNYYVTIVYLNNSAIPSSLFTEKYYMNTILLLFFSSWWHSSIGIHIKKITWGRFRSSRPEVFYKKGVLRYFPKFTGKHLCQSLFFNKVAGLSPATLLKKTLWRRCFPVNFVKFLRTPFLWNNSGG